jgi:hypothetical protein
MKPHVRLMKGKGPGCARRMTLMVFMMLAETTPRRVGWHSPQRHDRKLVSASTSGAEHQRRAQCEEIPALGGELRDDTDEDLIGEGADVIDSVIILDGSNDVGEEGGGGYMWLRERGVEDVEHYV